MDADLRRHDGVAMSVGQPFHGLVLHRHPINQAAEEIVADCELVFRDPFVGLMHLGKVSGAAHHAGDAGGLEQRALAAIAHLAAGRRAGDVASRARQIMLGWHRESREVEQYLVLESRAGAEFVHPRLDCAGHMRLEAGEFPHRVVGRYVAPFNVEARPVRQRIRQPAAGEIADLECGVGRIEARFGRDRLGRGGSIPRPGTQWPRRRHARR